MKLSQNNIEFMETHEMGKLVDIEKKDIQVEKIGMYIDKYGDKKVVFTITNDKKHYFYMPNVLTRLFNDNNIEKINNGQETIKGTFEKKSIANGRAMWVFTDK